MESELDNLDQRLRTYYRGQKLSAAIASRLKDAIHNPVATLKPSVPWRLTRLVWVAAVCSLLAAVGVAWLLLLFLLQRSGADVTRVAAQEVAANHHKQLAVEFAADDVADLSRQMQKLDFTPLMPERFRDGRHRLLGARYCSLRGQIAAQIRMTTDDGRVCTLYEARPIGPLSAVRQDQIEVDGCEVRLWREGGLLMVLARPPH